MINLSDAQKGQNPIPPPLSHRIRVHREGGRGGGELTRENVRWAVVHKAARKFQHDRLYLQSINSTKHQKRRHLEFGVFIDN
jgi:hypothetical protein